MSDNIHWVVDAKIKDGAYLDFEALMQEMVATTKANEPETLAYEWYVSADKSTCHIYERYSDNAAVMVHQKTFGAQFAERFMAVLEVRGLMVYGAANDAVRTALAPVGAVFMDEVGGFAR